MTSGFRFPHRSAVRSIASWSRRRTKWSKGQPLAKVKASELAQAQADLSASAASLASARAQLATGEANAARQKALLSVQGAAVRDVEQANSDLAAARAAVNANDAAATAMRNRVRILGYNDAQIETLSRQTAQGGPIATIRASIAGKVIQRQVGPGQYLNSTANGTTSPLLTISDVSKVWLMAYVCEEDADRVRLGDELRVRVIALPERIFAAKISFVSPAVDPVTRRLAVRAVL
jgi:cobalt-zinc-cadmium efflux system membrane fusion protein